METEARPVLGATIALGSPFFIFILMKFFNHFLLATWPWKVMNSYASVISPYLFGLLELGFIAGLIFFIDKKISQRIAKEREITIKELTSNQDYFLRSLWSGNKEEHYKHERTLRDMFKLIDDLKKTSPLTSIEQSTDAVIKNFM